jgi:hypothetical protein
MYKRLAAAEFHSQQPPILYAGEYVSAGIEGAVISGAGCGQAIIDADRGGVIAARNTHT